jgi:hypothetical protein
MEYHRRLQKYSDEIQLLWWYQPDTESCIYVVGEMNTGQLFLLRYKLSALSWNKSYSETTRNLGRMATNDILRAR